MAGNGLAAFEVDATRDLVANHGVGPSYDLAREPDAIIRKPVIRLGIIRADELCSAGECLITLGWVIAPGLHGVSIRPSADDKTIADEFLNAVELLNWVVDIKPGGCGIA